MITRFKQPRIEAKTAQWYRTGYVPATQFYPGVRQGRLWLESKKLARQAYQIETGNTTAKTNKKDIFTNILSKIKRR